MQGKIQIAAPDDACFGKKRPQMLHRIQPFYSRKCDHSAGWRIYTRHIKEQLLPTVTVHFGKQTAFKAPADSLEAGDKELKKEPVPGKPAELKRQSEKKDTVRHRSERRPRPRLLQTTEKQ